MNGVSGKNVVVVLLAVLSLPVIIMILAIIWAFWPGS